MHTEGNRIEEARNEVTQDSLQEAQKQARRGQRSPHCANCDIEILWTPVVVQETFYCCTGCAAGGPCNCDYSQYRSVNIGGVIHYG